MAAPIPSAAPGRDTALDVWRGFALVTIFINHVSGNVLENWTHKNFGFSDAADLFVFFAGYAAASAYFSRYLEGDRFGITMKVLSRAVKLYTTHLALVVLGAAVFATKALKNGDLGLMSVIALEPLMLDPAGAMVDAATLRYQPGFLNILPLYFVLIGLLPLLMALAARSMQAALGLSFAIWLAAGLTGANFPSLLPGGWFFNPLSWQFLFVLGFALGARRARTGQAVSYHRGLWWAAAGYLFIGMLSMQGTGLPSPGWLPLPDFLTVPEKQFVSLPRLLHLLALAYVVVFSPLQDWARSAPRNHPLAMMGRHSLPIFCTGLLVSLTGVAFRQTGYDGVLFDITYVTAGIVTQMLVAGLLTLTEKRRSLPASSDAAALPVAAKLS
ncbi:OpgC family protein [Pseudoroseomonas cervicalis]|uniref:OpgC family protein n=1 Tax=Teichococcus cervicalis TaxID=204525 RepID=UPI0022F1AE30|nr:OpgC domain-containing protein [Pseudoroseomonas cervicalis]WBV42129.1 OpgC domain-containing protein [Pseudoroseomonas cervicalis]